MANSPPKALQRFRGLVPFDQAVAAVSREIREMVDSPRRPAYLDRFDPFAVPDPKMETRVAGRLIAAAAEPLGDLPVATGDDRDPGADAVAIRGRPP